MDQELIFNFGKFGNSALTYFFTFFREDLYERLLFLQNAVGIIPSPFDCYLVNRSLKTLAVRMRQHMANGLAVGRFLEGHSAVEKVYHPGLASHPQHELTKRQCSGVSGMVSFVIKGNLDTANKFLQSLKVSHFTEIRKILSFSHLTGYDAEGRCVLCVHQKEPRDRLL